MLNPRTSLKYIIDQSNQQLFDLHMEHFFNFPYLVELNLSNNQLWYLPLSISNCILLEHVDISDNPMSRPPAVLFSIPKLRSNPQNIIFGRNQKCTSKLAQKIMDDSCDLNHCSLTFNYFDSSIYQVLCPPEATTKDVFKMAYPELRGLRDYFVLVRKYKEYILRINPEDVPIALYFIPNAIWSLELKFLPATLPLPILPAISKYINDVVEEQKNDQSLMDLAQEVKFFKETDSNLLYNLLLKLQTNKYLCARHFTANLATGGAPKQIRITANADGVSIGYTPSAYYTFDPRSISFDFVQDETMNEYCLLMCGNRALQITDDSVPGLMLLFSYTSAETIATPNKSKRDFLKLIRETMPTYMDGKNPRLTKNANNRLHDNLECILDKLRAMEGSSIRFSRPVAIPQAKVSRCQTVMPS